MALVNQIKQNLQNQNLNVKQKANLQKQLSSVQKPPKPAVAPTVSPTPAPTKTPTVAPTQKTTSTYSTNVQPGKTPEIYKPGYQSTKYTKTEATDFLKKKMASANPPSDNLGITNVGAKTIDEAEKLRIARGQIAGKPEDPMTPASNEPKIKQQPIDSSTPSSPDGTEAPVDEGTKMLQDATDEYVKGLDSIKAEYNIARAEDIESIQREYEAKKKLLDESRNIMQTLNTQRMESIDKSTAAQRAEVDAAYQRQTDAVKLQQKATEKAFQDMMDAQKLANKRAEIKKETAMGLLGGAFTSAGAADIEDVIMQGEFKLRSIAKDEVLEQQGLTNQLVSLHNDYKVDNLKIEDWKQQNINSAYKDLMDQISKIQEEEYTAESDKEQAIRDVADRYNQKVSQISVDALTARYNLATTIVERADNLRKEAEDKIKMDNDLANKERDDARTALQNLVTNLPANTFTSMTAEQKAQLRMLEEKAGYPTGLFEQGIETFKEEAADQKEIYQNATIDIKERMIALKEKYGDKVHYNPPDENGNVTATVWNGSTFENISLGKVTAAKGTSSKVTKDEFGNVVGGEGEQSGGGGMSYAGEAFVPTNSLTGLKASFENGEFKIAVPKGQRYQCGAFVNRTWGIPAGGKGGLGSPFSSKAAVVEARGVKAKGLTDYSKLKPGMAFVMQVPGLSTGHTGFMATMPDEKGNFKTVEANASGGNGGIGGVAGGNGGEISYRTRNVKDMYGFVYPPNAASTVKSSMTPEQFALEYQKLTGKDATKQQLALIRKDPSSAQQLLDSFRKQKEEKQKTKSSSGSMSKIEQLEALFN